MKPFSPPTEIAPATRATRRPKRYAWNRRWPDQFDAMVARGLAPGGRGVTLRVPPGEPLQAYGDRVRNGLALYLHATKPHLQISVKMTDDGQLWVRLLPKKQRKRI